MGKQLGVRQMPQTRAIVGHDVSWTWDVIVQCQVAVMPLVEGHEAEQISRWSCGSGGPFALPIHGGRVVGAVVHGALTDVCELR